MITLQTICHAMTAPDAYLAFRDRLEELGYAELLEEWIVQPGNKAKVKWPVGWSLIAR